MLAPCEHKLVLLPPTKADSVDTDADGLLLFVAFSRVALDFSILAAIDHHYGNALRNLISDYYACVIKPIISQRTERIFPLGDVVSVFRRVN